MSVYPDLLNIIGGYGSSSTQIKFILLKKHHIYGHTYTPSLRNTTTIYFDLIINRRFVLECDVNITDVHEVIKNKYLSCVMYNNRTIFDKILLTNDECDELKKLCGIDSPVSSLNNVD